MKRSTRFVGVKAGCLTLKSSVNGIDETLHGGGKFQPGRTYSARFASTSLKGILQHKTDQPAGSYIQDVILR